MRQNPSEFLQDLQNAPPLVMLEYTAKDCLYNASLKYIEICYILMSNTSGIVSLDDYWAYQYAIYLGFYKHTKSSESQNIMKYIVGTNALTTSRITRYQQS